MRSLPQSIEAEQSVIGSMIIDKNAIAKVLESLNGHKVIYKAILEMFRNDMAVDLVTLLEYLKSTEMLERAGGVTYITEVSSSVPSTANLSSYIKIVSDKSTLRKLIKASTTIIEESYNNQSNVENVVDVAEKKIFNIAENRTSKDFESLGDVLERGFMQIEKLFNNKGEVIIEPKFDLIVSGFNEEGFAIIKENGIYGTINTTGEYIIKPKYLSISQYKEQVLSVTNVNYKSGVIDKDDKILIDFKFESIAEFSEGLACFSEKDKCGFINKNGNVVIEPQYHSLWGFYNGLSAFSLAPDESFGFIDKNGNVKIDNKYQTVGDFCDELATFTNDDLSGYINKDGEEIIKNVFATAYDFKNALALVTTAEGEWGYINNKGEWVYKPKNFKLW